jgi:hypothetical protein
VTTNSRVNTGAEKSWPAVCLHRRSVVEPPDAWRRRRLHKKSSSLSTHAGFFSSNASSRCCSLTLSLLHSAKKRQAKPVRNFTEDGSVNSVYSVKGALDMKDAVELAEVAPEGCPYLERYPLIKDKSPEELKAIEKALVRKLDWKYLLWLQPC